MKALRILLVALFVAAFAAVTAQQPKPTVKVINQAEFATLVGGPVGDSDWKAVNTRPAVVDFNAVWCGPCRKLAPILDSLAVEMPNVDFYSIDVDENKPLARQLGITNIPMVLICPVGGQPQAIVGLYPKDELKKAIDYVNSKQ